MTILSNRRNRMVLGAVAAVVIAGVAYVLGSASPFSSGSSAVDPAFAEMLRTRDTAANAGGLSGTGEKDGATPSMGTTAVAPAPVQTCSAPLALALTDGNVALGGTGITPRTPGAEFDLTGLSVRMEGECDSAGKPKNAKPVLETVWLHRQTSLTVNVRQTPAAATPPGNFLGQGIAVFTDGGYDFSVSLNGYITAADGGVVKPAVGTSVPAIAPERQGGTSAESEAVLNAAVKGLAPAFPAQCFAREVAGDWPDAQRLGVGDPRPALPSGYTLQSSSIRYVQPAAADCATPGRKVPGGGLQLWANFSDTRGALNISAYAVEVLAESPGWANGYGLSWTRNGITYSLNGSKEGEGIGLDVLRKVAASMDSGFASACLVEQREISANDLPGLGYRDAKPPSGWTLINAGGVSAVPSSSCSSSQAQDYGGVSFRWTFARATSAIDASINRYGPKTGGSGAGLISDTSISWSDGKGTMYSVNTWGLSGKGAASRDDLIAVAKSLDPSLDPSTLTESQGGIAIDGGGASSGSGSTSPMPPTR